MNNIYFSILKDLNNENDKSKQAFQQYKWDYNLEEDKDDDNVFSYKRHHRNSSNSSIISNNNRISALKFAASNNERSLPSSPSYSSSSSSSNSSPNPFKSQNKSKSNLFSNEVNNNDDLSQSPLRKIKSGLFETVSYNNGNQLFKAKSMIALPSTSTINATSNSSINSSSDIFHKKNLFNVNPEDVISRSKSQILSVNEYNNKDLLNHQLVPPTPIIDAENPFIESSTKIKRMFEKKNLFNILPRNDSFPSQTTLLNMDDSDNSDSSCPPSPLISRSAIKSKSSKNMKSSNSTLSLSTIDDDDSDAPYKHTRSHTRSYTKRIEELNKNALQNMKTNKINYTNNNPSKTTIMNLNESIDDSYTSNIITTTNNNNNNSNNNNIITTTNSNNNNNTSFVYNTRSRTRQNLMNCEKQNDINDQNCIKVGPVIDANKKSSKSKNNKKSHSISSPLMKGNNDSVTNTSFKYTQIEKNKGTTDSPIINNGSQEEPDSKLKTNSNDPIISQLKSQKSNSSFSASGFSNDPFHTTSLSHQNSLNPSDVNKLSSTPPTFNESKLTSQMKTPTKSSQNDTVKTEKSILSSTSNFVNMILLPKKTPQKTPSSRRRNSMCGDRFIPNYSSGDKETQYNLAGPITPSKGKRRLPPSECDAVKEEQNKIYDSVVKLELLGQDLYDNPLDKINKHRTSVYSFKTPKKRTYQMMDSDSPSQHKYSLTPVSQASQNLLLTPRKATRHISKTPYKVLDAPELQVIVFTIIFLII
ncbi:hypothetical protein PIROE2DRAFT_19039 [Piromyces sp. E2]|nr:hypothetical protein PIROE2DRAFT_19039 [Piromyces sp. E2]|eukprot:OUM56374.1 hypothetical protein PIROE2DRAFT_19039 [Piromyces sp. E2]